jgi:aarF domain-containing kinase
MAAKRILDAVALFNASRNVAAKHVDIRLAQVDLYSRTSSLVKAVRSRAEPNLTSAVQRVSQTPPLNGHSPQTTDIPTAYRTAESSPPRNTDEGVKQDHFPRGQGSIQSPTLLEENLDIEQSLANGQPLPDGPIPPKDSPVGQNIGNPKSYSERHVLGNAQHPQQQKGQGHSDDLGAISSNQSTITDPTATEYQLSPDPAREAQRASEWQIPAMPAEPPNSEGFRPDVASGEGSEFSVQQEQDAFYQPPGSASPVLSALPQVHLPKVEWDIQGGDPHIPNGINADVFYSGEKLKETQTNDEPSEEMLSQIFSSPKVARLLRKGKKPDPIGGAVRAFHTSALLQQKDAVTERESLRKLAADMTEDVGKATSVSFP